MENTRYKIMKNTKIPLKQNDSRNNFEDKKDRNVLDSKLFFYG